MSDLSPESLASYRAAMARIDEQMKPMRAKLRQLKGARRGGKQGRINRVLRKYRCEPVKATNREEWLASL